ncbi:MAG: hypothetical protein J6S76_04530 [Clostridia bacterium]|nr:hypothetical protein [Clostridia bacterium]
MKRKKEAKQQRIRAAVNGVVSAYRGTGEDTDVLGMYTGVSHLADTGAPTSAIDGGTVCRPHPEMPVQDADDL